eukprot:g16757.t1
MIRLQKTDDDCRGLHAGAPGLRGPLCVTSVLDATTADPASVFAKHWGQLRDQTQFLPAFAPGEDVSDADGVDNSISDSDDLKEPKCPGWHSLKQYNTARGTGRKEGGHVGTSRERSRGGRRSLLRHALARMPWLRRELQYDSSEDGDDDDRWTDLRGGDWVNIGLTSFYQVAVLGAVLFLWINRSWPPLVPRQVSLVCVTGLTGILAFFGAIIASGAIERHSNDPLSHCGLNSVLSYTTWGVWISVVLVRVYRSWKILVKHSVDMWPPWAQVSLLTVPWCTPLLVYSIDDQLSRYNERRNWCEVYDPVDTAMYILGCVPIAAAFVLVYQMRKVRKQMNEYRLQVFQLAFVLVIGTIVFPLQHLFLDNRHEIRRIWTLWHNVFDSLVLFWPPVAEPIYRYLSGDSAYLESYTKGFSTLPTPAQMKSSLRDQLSQEQLRAEFEKFAESRVAKELPEFYQACLDRDEVEDFFGRQAATTYIVDRYIRPGAEQEINVSDRIRNKILATEITSYNIFEEAMSAVVAMMESNFSAAFKRTAAYKNLERNVQKEADELERLRKMNQLPAKEHVQSEPKGLLKLIRNILPSAEPPAPSGSSVSGSSSHGADGRERSTTSSHHSGTTGRSASLSIHSHNTRASFGRAAVKGEPNSEV